jgi:hypothetical protein
MIAESSAKMNGSIIRLQREEYGSPPNSHSGRICDRLSIEVSEACDRFFRRRKMQTDFRWIAQRIRMKKEEV